MRFTKSRASAAMRVQKKPPGKQRGRKSAWPEEINMYATGNKKQPEEKKARLLLGGLAAGSKLLQPAAPCRQVIAQADVHQVRCLREAGSPRRQRVLRMRSRSAQAALRERAQAAPTPGFGRSKNEQTRTQKQTQKLNAACRRKAIFAALLTPWPRSRARADEWLTGRLTADAPAGRPAWPARPAWSAPRRAAARRSPPPAPPRAQPKR